MNTTDQIITLLITERDRLDRAIQALQEPVKHRGRPPKSGPMAVIAAAAPAGPGRRKGRSAAQRKAQSEKMKAYWAKRRKDAAKNA